MTIKNLITNQKIQKSELIAKMDKIKRSHEQFKMPYSLDVSKLTISKQRKGISDSFVNFYKELVCEAFSEKKKLCEVADYISDDLCERQGGLWFCSIENCKSIGNYSLCFKNDQSLLFKFERNGTNYLISMV